MCAAGPRVCDGQCDEADENHQTCFPEAAYYQILPHAGHGRQCHVGDELREKCEHRDCDLGCADHAQTQMSEPPHLVAEAVVFRRDEWEQEAAYTAQIHSITVTRR